MMTKLTMSFSAFALLVGSALAHSPMKTSEPADGDVLDAAPEEIVLRFDKPARVTVVTLEDETGDEIGLERGDGMRPIKELTLTPDDEIAPGVYSLKWRALGSDGHPMKGGFGFTVGDE